MAASRKLQGGFVALFCHSDFRRLSIHPVSLIDNTAFVVEKFLPSTHILPF